MERRPRVCRNEKLLDSGKPERKMPLSTMAKLSGGMKRSSAHSSPAAVSGEWWTSPTTSIVLHISSWLSSSFISALHREGEREREGGRERATTTKEERKMWGIYRWESLGGLFGNRLGYSWPLILLFGLRYFFSFGDAGRDSWEMRLRGRSLFVK